MTAPEVRCECWAHCAIARRQEREQTVYQLLAVALERKELGFEDQSKLLAGLAFKLKDGFDLTTAQAKENP
jgi:hypothetical protein